MADREGMIELAEFFFTQAGEEMIALDQAINEADPDSIRRLAHRLLGASAGCGMSRLVPQLAQLEQQSKQGDLTNARPLFSQLSGILDQTRAEFERWCSANRS